MRPAPAVVEQIKKVLISDIHESKTQSGYQTSPLAAQMVIVAMENAPNLTDALRDNQPENLTNDYVASVVLNEAGHALIFEKPRRTGVGVHWHVLSQALLTESDPFTAVQTALLRQTGYRTSHWSYLGSHAAVPNQPGGVGYFFCAQNACQFTKVPPIGNPQGVIRWVPLTDLRYALLDGRMATVSHALTVSLTLLTLRP